MSFICIIGLTLHPYALDSSPLETLPHRLFIFIYHQDSHAEIQMKYVKLHIPQIHPTLVISFHREQTYIHNKNNEFQNHFIFSQS